MLTTHLDHITIVAPTLAEGVEYVRQSLGVTPQTGGQHPRMGTHNALLKLGDEIFLEVIAVDPDAQAPDRARWFELDRLAADAAPRLATWVARTSDIQAAAAAAPGSLGSIEPMSRGSLNWLITIPPDGSLPLHGAAPTLIRWQNGPHPAKNLQDQGCSLVMLEAYSPHADAISHMLRSAGFGGGVSVSRVPEGTDSYLVAHIQTPTGMRILGSA